MNSFSVGIKKFFSNKNTVTVVGVALAILVLYFWYEWRVKSSINPVTVPYALKTISPGTQITDELIGTIEVPPAMIKGNAYTRKSDVVDMYAAIDTVIPEGSLFYQRSVVSKEKLKTNILSYPKNYVLYNLTVNMSSTYSNSMVPGNYIDIYLKVMNHVDENETVTENNDKIMVGKLLENVKILGVYDSNGQSVFANVDENRTPAQIIFAVPEEYHILLRKASYLRAYDSEIIPVPTNESLEKHPGDVKISNEDLKNFINRVTAMTEADLAQQ